MLEFHLMGGFRVTDSEGEDRRPSLQKARAILAILAATPGHSRSRSWLRARLWSDRQHEQGLSSLRTALSDVRRNLGPYADVLRTDQYEISLDPAQINVDMSSASPGMSGTEFLDGFDVPHAEGFEDWLRETRASLDTDPPRAKASVQPACERPESVASRLLLATLGDAPASVPRILCDALVDCLAKSVEDLKLAQVFDARGSGTTLDDYGTIAADNGCDIVLLSDTAEAANGAILRLRALEMPSRRLVWSKSLIGDANLQLDDPAFVSMVPEFVDLLSDKLLRQRTWTEEATSPLMSGLLGVNHIFKLGAQNFETADTLLAQANDSESKSIFLAWRAFLRTFMFCEREFGGPETVVEEGTAFTRRALELDPHNSMVLALCAHVENLLHNSYERAHELATRALEINRCNPLAWASLGSAEAFVGDPQRGLNIAKIGAQLSAGSKYHFQTQAWASVAAVLAGDVSTAISYAKRSHLKSPTFAPPMRYLCGLNLAEHQYADAEIMARKLKAQEPDFDVAKLWDSSYPTNSLRRANVLRQPPQREF